MKFTPIIGMMLIATGFFGTEAAGLNKCNINGKTVYQQSICPGKTSERHLEIHDSAGFSKSAEQRAQEVEWERTLVKGRVNRHLRTMENRLDDYTKKHGKRKVRKNSNAERKARWRQQEADRKGQVGISQSTAAWLLRHGAKNGNPK